MTRRKRCRFFRLTSLAVAFFMTGLLLASLLFVIVRFGERHKITLGYGTIVIGVSNVDLFNEQGTFADIYFFVETTEGRSIPWMDEYYCSGIHYNLCKYNILSGFDSRSFPPYWRCLSPSVSELGSIDFWKSRIRY